MSTIPVRFTYLTGIRPEQFGNVRLHGSWDANGLRSEQWSNVPMQKIRGEDGCPAYTATVNFDASEAGQEFRWGVSLDGPAGKDLWGVMAEVKDAVSRERYRTFHLSRSADGRPLQERYYVNRSRCLGAQKYYQQGQDRPGIRFAVWAPNARNVEVVMSTLWNIDDPRRTPATDLSKPRAADLKNARPTDVGKLRATKSLPRDKICGGYVADDGAGAHPQWGPFPMKRQPDGVWVTDVNDPELSDFDKFDHAPFMFRITRSDGSVAYRTDLYSRCQIGYGGQRPAGEYYGRTLDLDGSVSCSVIVNPDLVTKDLTEHPWPEQYWLEPEDFWKEEFTPGKPVPQRLEDLVIYELHVGALGFDKKDDDGNPLPGTLQDAVDLLDYLEDLGVNTIELLPMSEFGGGGAGWGYATSHYFAIEYSGGGRDNYKWFVRECHRRGMAVILDVVYNHYNHDAERAEWMYDATSHEDNVYYWYEGKSTDYPDFDRAVTDAGEAGRVGTGGYVDNLSTGWAPRFHEELVRKMFISSAVALALEFHVDGFRMDQTTSIHAYNSLHANGSTVGAANAFGQKLLRELTRTLKFVKPQIMLTAEDHSNWDMVTVPADAGGLGFDATWYSDFYHHLMGDTDKGDDYAKLIKNAGFGDDRALKMDYFAGALASSGSRRVVYNESHDEAGNGEHTDRSINTAVNNAPLNGQNGKTDTRRYAEARCRFALGMSLLSAGTPMFLFGEEVGSEKKFLYGKVLDNRDDLRALRAGPGKDLFEFYSNLIRLRRSHSGLRSPNIDVFYIHNDNRVLAFRRWDGDEELVVAASLNNHPFDATYAFDGVRLPDGNWREVFNSDAGFFGGDNVGNQGAEKPSQSGRFETVIPANGFVVFQKVG